GIGVPTKGTPQGGIISPLLANVVLNELDWWISSQWETFETKNNYGRKRGNRIDVSNKYRAMKQTKLKEIFLVRYADDFKIFCKDYQTAQKVFIAVKNWLKERLELEISSDKSKITNLRKNYTEFLGFKLMVKPKNKKYVCQSRMCNKAVQSTIKKLKEQIKKIQKTRTVKEVLRLNSMILGSHNYYKSATNIALDVGYINFLVMKSLDIRLRSSISNKPEHSETYKRLYGNYTGKARTIKGVTIFPIYGCKNKPPMCFTQEICNYTKSGRELIHKNLQNGALLIMKYLAKGNEYMSAELFDNSISLIAGQQGVCYITQNELEIGNMECHHKKPKSIGGTDEYKNLIWLCYEAHKLVHSTESDTINKYLSVLKLDEKGLKRLNTLRKLVGNSVI
ncbi:group II intron reverse transcriptase/maturase, partial [Clostridium botulinum D/C]